MYWRVLRTVALASLTAFAASPAIGQIRADLGPVHIRIATDAPPRAQSEHRPARPHQDSVWIGGYWDRQGDRWAWESGRWEQPRDRHSRWINARYQREGKAWRYEPAHWSDQQLIEGDDYQRWKSEQHPNHGR